MTLQELLAKNASIKAARELTKVSTEIQKSDIEEPVESSQTAPKRKGKRPNNRQYMVIDQDAIYDPELDGVVEDEALDVEEAKGQ